MCVWERQRSLAAAVREFDCRIFVDVYKRQVLYFANKLFSLLLGVVMVVAFAAQYPYVSTRTYSTFPIPVPYTVQYFPMCLAGAYMALESLRQMAEHVAEKARGSRAQV